MYLLSRKSTSWVTLTQTGSWCAGWRQYSPLQRALLLLTTKATNQVQMCTAVAAVLGLVCQHLSIACPVVHAQYNIEQKNPKVTINMSTYKGTIYTLLAHHRPFLS